MDELVKQITNILKQQNGIENRFIIFTRFVEKEARAIFCRFVKAFGYDCKHRYSVDITDCKQLLYDNKNGKSVAIVTEENSEDLKNYQGLINLPTVLILTYQIAEQGIDLPGYNYVVNYHITASPSALEQRFGRIDRLSENQQSVSTSLKEIYACYLIPDNFVDSNLINFNYAINCFIEDIISWLPSRNVVLTKTLLELYSDAKRNMYLYIETLKNKLDIEGENLYDKIKNRNVDIGLYDFIIGRRLDEIIFSSDLSDKGIKDIFKTELNDIANSIHSPKESIEKCEKLLEKSENSIIYLRNDNGEISYDNITTEDCAIRKYNKELSQYAAIYDGKFTVVGAVTDFTLFDVTDYPRYQNLFRKADGKTLTGNVFQLGTIKGYSVPYTFGLGKEDNSAYGELPMVEDLYDDRTRKGSLKTGYGFRFAFNTIGSYQGNADAVEITPTFFFVPKGKESEERIPVDLYYTETIKNTTKKLVKVGGNVDVSNQKSVYVNDKMFGIKEFLNRRLNLYYYGKIGLTSAVRMFPDVGEATIVGSSPTDYTLVAGADAEKMNKSVQTWYGVYSLPTQVHACPKDYDLTAYDLINYREDFWLTDGYIVVNFEIKVFKDGKESIRYYEGTDPRGNMWAMENGTKDGVRTIEDMNGVTWQFQPGDVVVYYADKSSRDDYKPGGTH